MNEKFAYLILKQFTYSIFIYRKKFQENTVIQNIFKLIYQLENFSQLFLPISFYQLLANF